MRIGTNTAIYSKCVYEPGLMDETEIIRRLHEIGFQSLDFSLAFVGSPYFVLSHDDWQKRVDRIADTAAACGMVFSQVHLPFHRKGCPELDERFRDPGFAELYDECTRRAYIAGGMVGAPWAVAHCMSPLHIGFDRKKAAEINHAYYDPFVELGIKNGIGTAFENMIQGGNHLHIRYTAHQDDLIDYVDSYHDPMVGICWDFGHANITGLEQPAALRKVGKRLVCTHVDDNYGINDNHIIPFMGMVKWFDIIPAEIGYKGELSLEVGIAIKNAPRDLQDSFVRSSFDACQYLVKMFEKEQERLQADSAQA